MTRANHFYISKPHRLHYSVHGSGPPLILVHGLSGSKLWWRKNIPALAQHFTVYTVDLVGYGRSNFQKPLGFAESADLLEGWMESLGLENVYYVGHSMGGQTGLHVVNRYPKRVKKLVLAASSGLVDLPFVPALFKLAQAGMNGRKLFLATVALDTARASLSNILHSGRTILADEIRPLLLRVGCPTLLIWAEKDPVITLPMAQTYRLIPDSRLKILPHAGHNLMYDNPVMFNQMILDFLLE
jgi:pimeloyl-ACP methyl ester carboxylesterase